MNGDPMGIAPYAVTKWAAQSNGAPGIADNRGGTHVGTVNTTTSPTDHPDAGRDDVRGAEPRLRDR